MQFKHVYGFYALFTLMMFGGGAVSIAFSIIFGQPNLFFNMIFSKADLTSGLITGIFLAATAVLAIFAAVQRNHVTTGLVWLNWMLIADFVVVLVVGTRIWFFSLRQRAEFFNIYSALPTETRVQIQDMFSCCGYFKGNDSTVVVGQGFCANQTFVDNLDTTVLTNFCVSPITAKTDYALENTFTSIFAFMVPIFGLFLASLCVIHVRNEIERFKKIDSKRGGRGFV